MAGNSKSGRRRSVGRLYRINIRVQPGKHSAELAELLDLLTAATPTRRADILNDMAAGGGLAAARAAVSPEAVETEQLLEDLFG